MTTKISDQTTLDVLQTNVQLLAEKERLEDERRRLLELDRNRTEFLARISHDLRTPLSSIIGFSDLILTGEMGKLKKRHLDFIQAINRNGHQLLALINDLLDLTTLESRRISIRRESVPLGELLADLRAATDPVLCQAGLRARWPEPEVVAGMFANVDRRRLLQVLTNLVDNARKFTPTGGMVEISLWADAEEARFAVADTGPGIPEDARAAIFRPYAQRGAAPARGEGVGLGLAIVKAIVDLHGGAIILAEGPEIGTGCTFRIRIPQHDVVPAAAMSA